MQNFKKINVKSIIEYILCFLLILSCGSVFDNMTNANFYISEIFMVLLFLYVLLFLFPKFRKQKKTFLKFIIFFAFYVVYQAIYILVHRNMPNMIVYTFKLVIIFLLLMMFYLFSNKDKINDIIRKISKIIIIISIISIFFFALGSYLKIIQPTNKVQIEFGNNNRAINSYFNIYFEAQETSIFGDYRIRNCAIFVEAPMFTIGLLIAISYELFLNKEKKRKRNIILLFITILTTMSTTGIAVGSGLIALKIMYVIFNKNRTYKGKKVLKLITISFIIVLGIISFIVIKDKWNSPSFMLRIDDYLAGYKAWEDHKIFGNGYQNYEAVQNHMSERVFNNMGQSNSISNLFAEGGLWIGAVYTIPVIYLLVKNFKYKKYNNIMFILTLILIFCTIIFTYSIMIINFIAYGWSRILKKGEEEIGKDG